MSCRPDLCVCCYATDNDGLTNTYECTNIYRYICQYTCEVTVTVLKLHRFGNSTAVTIPKEVLHRLRVSQGDQLYLVETERGIELTPYDPDFAAQMDIAEQVMREDRDVLRKLAE